MKDLMNKCDEQDDQNVRISSDQQLIRSQQKNNKFQRSRSHKRSYKKKRPPLISPPISTTTSHVVTQNLTVHSVNPAISQNTHLPSNTIGTQKLSLRPAMDSKSVKLKHINMAEEVNSELIMQTQQFGAAINFNNLENPFKN